MESIINWQYLETISSWALKKDDKAAKKWDKGADGWQRRIDFERKFTEKQAAACARITADDTVLDACCGTGRLTIPLARRAKHVYAVDAGERMLAWCKQNADAAGLSNVETVQISNWHRCKPGKEIPIVDIAVACISPAQADIVKFSRCARKYCYSLSFSHGIAYRHCMFELFDGAGSWGPAKNRKAVPGKRSVQEDLKRHNMLGLNVPFNILYDLGADPEVRYVDGGWEHEADAKEEIYAYLAAFGEVRPDKGERFRANCDQRLTRTPEGRWRYAFPAQMYVIGWDPNKLKI